MPAKRVRVGRVYVYRPVLLDVIDSHASLIPGDRVRVIKSPRGCPPANTMGHCYVGTVATGQFIGMVHCNSLVKE